MFKNTLDNFGVVTKLFHWLIFALFLVMLPLGYIMICLAKSDFQFSLYSFHKATGLLLFCLITLRMIWRFINVKPTLSSEIPYWQRKVAFFHVFILYFLMFAMPASGLTMSLNSGHDISFYGLFTIPSFPKNSDISGTFAMLHNYFSYLLIATVSVHVIAALYHHFYLRDAVLKRMLPNYG